MLINKSSRKKITDTVEIKKYPLGKAIGLMFSRKKDRAMIFENWWESYTPLHMFFVFYPIDVLYLDSDKRVVEIKKRFLPFTVYHPKRKAKFVIEVLCGKADESRTKIGHKLEF